jgi:hypothetical protein
VPAQLYIAGVVLITLVGVVLQSPVPLVAAAVLTLPASLAAIPAYYVAYGLTALVPGANPSSSSGEGSSSARGEVTSTVTGLPAAWFTISMAVLLVVLLAGAAVLNVLAVEAFRARSRSRPRQLA